jgi:hypothetical protein
MDTDATSRNISTLESLSAFFEVMQPDNLMARHHIQKSVRLFELGWFIGKPHGQCVMNSGWMGHRGQPESQPSTVEN